ncbi:ubiquinol-cytochrome c reductase cytochrome c1 subunit [Litoreibacter ponti]|uniref:Cytochrome c1 n=1 Tax=Litoreibacter ponti TaxID=1510457 RepID=A0A2T6BP42_9RHOB|nr:cytochrome c1 [Litoreibacter ponti]PTX57853.1 ubiquinol-cytochrome c reductase cytochrome c1 subunit [Litoreibacter ponti]
MLKNATLAALAALTFTSGAYAAGGDGKTVDYDFSYEGPFGTYDENQLQRGLQVYTQVCSACHGLKFVPMRTLADEGGPHLPEEQMKAYVDQFLISDEAANMHLYDPEEDELRALAPTDNFPANNAAGAPDLSLMAKARAGFHGPYGTGINQLMNGIGGAEYIASLLTGYTGEEKEEAGTILYENTAFPGGWISMGPPLYGDDVEFADGTEATIEQQSKDVAAFLRWTAEPHQNSRKQTGFIAVFFLIVLTALLYLTNKRLWKKVKD